MMELLDWEDVITQISTDKNFVLLGNGFSRSYCDSSFNQKEILMQMPSLQGLEKIKDIEECIKETQKKILDISPEVTVPKSILEKWIKSQLHKEFINTLYGLMPQSLNDIQDFTNEKLLLYKTFLNNFDEIYTLNYDPLLYWMLMRFINYGNKDYIEYSNLNEQILNIEKETAEYKKIQNKLKNSNNKCMKAVRTEMYEKYLEDKDYYKMTLFCKDKILLEKNLKEAQKQFLIKWEKLSDGLYKALEENKNTNNVLKEESNILDKIAASTLEKKLKEVEINKENLKIKINDGFYEDTWEEDNSQTIFYLHGAFHLMEDKTKILKIKADDLNKMIKNIKCKWDEGYEPLTVLESSPEDKLTRIAKSKYLTKCLNKFKDIKGNLITHGVSFMASDKHIIDIINNNSNLKNIYIGCFGTVSEDIKNNFKDNPKVKFFDTSNMF